MLQMDRIADADVVILVIILRSLFLFKWFVLRD